MRVLFLAMMLSLTTALPFPNPKNSISHSSNIDNSLVWDLMKKEIIHDKKVLEDAFQEYRYLTWRINQHLKEEKAKEAESEAMERKQSALEAKNQNLQRKIKEEMKRSLAARGKNV